MIVFEDLKSLGYLMADREIGLDEDHCKIVLEKLGRFHAASMILAEQVIYNLKKYLRKHLPTILMN